MELELLESQIMLRFFSIPSYTSMPAEKTIVDPNVDLAGPYLQWGGRGTTPQAKLLLANHHICHFCQ